MLPYEKDAGIIRSVVSKPKKTGETEMSLTKKAVLLHPHRRNAAKWVLAIRWMRSKNLWVLEGGAAKWGHK